MGLNGYRRGDSGGIAIDALQFQHDVEFDHVMRRYLRQIANVVFGNL